MNGAAISSTDVVTQPRSIRAEQLGMRASGRLSGSRAEARPIVYIVDDDVAACDSLKPLIHHAGWEPSVCASAETFLRRPRLLGPCCLVLDFSLLSLSGLDLQRLVTERMEMPVICTGGADVPTVVSAMRSGAVDFVAKPFDTQTLLAAIACAIDRSRDALRRDAERLDVSRRFTSLSRREREVMALVVAGKLNKQVGRELGISEITVKMHRRNVMRKLRAGSLAELVQLAVRLNRTPTSRQWATPTVDAEVSRSTSAYRTSRALGGTRRVREWQRAGLNAISHDETHILIKILKRLLEKSDGQEFGSDQPARAHHLRLVS